MKNYFLLTLLALFIVSYAQDNSIIDTPNKSDFSYNNKTSDENQKLDTLYTYDVNLYETSTPFGIKYTVNGKEITKKKYDKYRQYWQAMDGCTPCLLRTFDEDDKIKYEAFQYIDCLCGEYTGYYKDGSTKVKGQFMKNPNETWENIKTQQFCNRRDGKWTYFFPNGTFEKLEVYKNGVLIGTKGNSELVPAMNVKNREDSTQDSEIEKKKPFFKRKN